jgi:hypothetical protein
VLAGRADVVGFADAGVDLVPLFLNGQAARSLTSVGY